VSDSVRAALAALRDLGSVSEMKAKAEAGQAPSERPKLNLHVHLPPNFSAFDSVDQVVDLAVEQEIDVLGVSNYYDYSVYGPFASEARKRGIFPLFGTEIICLLDELVKAGVRINDPANPGKMYVCGKGITRFDRLSPKAAELLSLIRHNDTERMAYMVERMAAYFAERGLDTGVTEQDVLDMIAQRHGAPPETITIQERHAAMAFQRAIGDDPRLGEIIGVPTDDPVKTQNAIRSALMKSGKPCFVEETFVDFDRARTLILELGGVPCYPTLADGASPICEYEEPVAKLIDNFKGLDFHAAEFIPIRNTPEALTRYVKAMRAAGFVISSGTEHNTLDLIPIEPTCVGGEPVPEDVKEVFWEGACVFAAHQFLTLHGECGYVDANGGPNPAYADAEARIADLARLGAAVIQEYRSGKA